MLLHFTLYNLSLCRHKINILSTLIYLLFLSFILFYFILLESNFLDIHLFYLQILTHTIPFNGHLDFDVTDEEIDKSLNDTKPHESTGHQPILISGKGSDIRGMLKASSSFYQNKNIFKLDNGVQAENASTQMMYDPQKGIWLGNNKDVEDFPDFDDSDSEKGQTPSVFVLTDKEKDVILKCAQEHQKSLNGWGVYANLTEDQLKEDKKSLKIVLSYLSI